MTNSVEIKTVNGLKKHKGYYGPLKIKSMNGYELGLPNVQAVANLSSLGHPNVCNTKRYEHLKDLDCESDFEIALLIGACVPEVFVSLESRVNKKNEPIGILGVLG